jgi:hypothetical protein
MDSSTAIPAVCIASSTGGSAPARRGWAPGQLAAERGHAKQQRAHHADADRERPRVALARKIIDLSIGGLERSKLHGKELTDYQAVAKLGREYGCLHA